VSWILEATGHVTRDIIEEQAWAALEKRLAHDLHTVLSKPEYGVVFSKLGLRLWQGAVHKETPTPPVPGMAPIVTSSINLQPEEVTNAKNASKAD
jgi:hypothetical protein